MIQYSQFSFISDWFNMSDNKPDRPPFKKSKKEDHDNGDDEDITDDKESNETADMDFVNSEEFEKLVKERREQTKKLLNEKYTKLELLCAIIKQMKLNVEAVRDSLEVLADELTGNLADQDRYVEEMLDLKLSDFTTIERESTKV